MPDGWTLVQPAAAAKAEGWTPMLPTKPAATEDYLPPQKSFTDHAVNFLSNFAHNVDPRPALKLLYDAADGLGGMFQGDATRGKAAFEDVKAIGAAQLEQFKKAKRDYDAGRWSEAVGHTIAGALPLVGPAAAAAGEQMGTGDVSGGLGAGAGLVAATVAPGAVAKALPKSVGVPGLGGPVEPVAAAAVAEGKLQGIPLDAATATGRPIVATLQKRVADTIGGAPTAERFQTQQQAALASTGDWLASRANRGRPMTPESAGQGAIDAAGGKVREFAAAADASYEKLRAIEGAPENLTTIAPAPVTANPDAPFSFTMKARPTVEEVFPEVLKDARANGYTGKVSDLREQFDARVEQSRGLKAATAEGDEYSHAALLKEIRSRGGLRPFDLEMVEGGPAIKARGEHIAAQQANAKYYGKNAVYRKDGLETSDMLQQLSEDPKWGAVITPDTDLIDLVHRGATKALEPTGNLEHHLRGVGVQPGTTWWRENATAQHVPLAVDMDYVKTAIKPLAERLAAKKGVVGSLMGEEATMADRLNAILSGPDAVPLSVADAARSDLLKIARTEHPELRNVGQGIAARSASYLHHVIGEAAERAGPHAVAALEEGRTATKAKVAAQEVREFLTGATNEPVQAFNRTVARDDTNIARVREAAALIPKEMPNIGRAFLDDVIGEATADGGFKKAATVARKWQQLGPETKGLMFKPDHVKSLDNFFRLAQKVTENANPSGSGKMINMNFAQLTTAVPAWALSKLLFTERGVNLLTEGFRVPIASPTLTASYLSRLSAAVQPILAAQPAMAGDDRTPPPVPTVRR